jgi:DNA-directed RNA polymerase specialized sigma24 family protein
MPLEEPADVDESGREMPVTPTPEDAPVWESPAVVTLEDVLPNHEAGEPWVQLAAIDQMKWVLTQLSELPVEQRRAFILHMLDGWEPDDVAMIQGRSVEEVRNDIESVREMLRSRLGGEFEIGPSTSTPGRRTQ